MKKWKKRVKSCSSSRKRIRMLYVESMIVAGQNGTEEKIANQCAFHMPTNVPEII